MDGEYSERPEHEVRFKCICSSHGSNIFLVKPKETKLNASILFWGVFFKGPFWDPKVFFISWLHYRPKTPVIFVVFEEEFSRPKDAEKNFCLGSLDFYFIKIHVEYKMSVGYEFDNVTSYWLFFF